MTTPDSDFGFGAPIRIRPPCFSDSQKPEQRRLDVGKMLDHVVADHEVEAAGREAIALDVAEDRFLGVVVVADLVLVDVDHGDVGAAQHVERQKAGRAAAGLVDRKPGRRQAGAENAVDGEQAVASLAGRQVEQRLRMRRARRPARMHRQERRERNRW